MLTPPPSNAVKASYTAPSWQGFSRRESVTLLFRYRWLLTLAFVLPILISIALIWSMPPVYKATSVLLLRMGSDYIYQPEANLSPTATQQALPLAQPQIVKSEIALLSSADLQRDVLRKIGVNALYPTLATPSVWRAALGVAPDDSATTIETAALEQFKRDFIIQPQKDSTIIHLSFQHSQAELAQQTLSELLLHYKAMRKKHFAHTGGVALRKAADDAYSRMQDSERTIAAYKLEHNVYEIESEQAALMKERMDLMQKRTRINSPFFDDWLVDVEDRLAHLRQAQHHLAGLEHAAKAARDEYAILLNRVDQAALQTGLAQEGETSIRILQNPTLPTTAPDKRAIIFCLGGVIGLVSLILTAVAMGYRRADFSSPEDVERTLGLKVIASLPLRPPHRPY